MDELCCLKKCTSGLRGMICHRCYDSAITTLTTALQAAREGLRKYGKHRRECHTQQPTCGGLYPHGELKPYCGCICGLDAALGTTPEGT